MYTTLFDLAGYALPAWLLLIALPKWRFTRWLAESAIIPVLICVIYLAGVGLLLTSEGFGFMADFGTAEGVTGLLARQDVAMVAWIHILAFDQLVGLFIYRDNMQHRYVPLVVQSVILFLTLMLGPVGFLLYYLIRLMRRDRAIPGEASAVTGSAPQFLAGRGIPDVIRMGVARMMMVRPLVVAGVSGIVAGLFCLAIIAIRGSAFVAPEGDLMKAATFNIAVGLYILTLTFFVPGARFSERGRGIWVWLTVAILFFSFSLETIQILRGLDPRFTRVGSATVQLLGGVFFFTALTLVVLFGILSWKYLRRRDDSASPLMLAIRYGFACVYAGFAAGVWLSVNNGSEVAPAGNILPLHALGFHGLQAIPIVALMLMWSGTPAEESRKWIHVAGTAWLLACAAVTVQTMAGLAPLAVGPGSIAAAIVMLVWLGVALLAFRRWAMPSAIVRPAAS